MSRARQRSIASTSRSASATGRTQPNRGTHPHCNGRCPTATSCTRKPTPATSHWTTRHGAFSRSRRITSPRVARSAPRKSASRARVIAGMCAAVQGNTDVRAMTFTVAILEEAGKATPPEALMVALRSHRTIFVGDTRQLPPHVWNPMQTVLREPHKLTTSNAHLTERAQEIRQQIENLGSTPDERQAADEETLFGHFARRLRGTRHEATLHTQYRMLPEIGELVSNVFYSDIGGLEHGRKPPIDPRVRAYAGDTRVKLIDIPGAEEKEGKSKHRGAEVEHIRRELRALNDHASSVPPPPGGPARLGVAVITPYSAQAKRLARELRLHRGPYPALNVRIGIVDSFQGDEDQVVILSIAATTVAGFLKTPNRINVAVSRAQDLLIITTSLPAAMQGKVGEPLQNVARFIDARVKQHDPAYQISRPKQPGAGGNPIPRPPRPRSRHDGRRRAR
ncbi:MAG: DEAD/DEAH box helicase [Solirubrobacteraceae bacterium]